MEMEDRERRQQRKYLYPLAVLGAVVLFLSLSGSFVSNDGDNSVGQRRVESREDRQQRQQRFVDDAFLRSNWQWRSNVATNEVADIGEYNLKESPIMCKNYEEYQQLSNLDCTNKTLLQRLKLALIMENCAVAVRSVNNARMVAQKIRKLADNNQFVFFRGVAGLFDYNMMCSEEPETYLNDKTNIPKVLSNGDCHPENFGVMVQANDDLVWGVNDFDQGFNAPFTWDIKRGGKSSGTLFVLL